MEAINVYMIPVHLRNIYIPLDSKIKNYILPVSFRLCNIHFVTWNVISHSKTFRAPLSN